jgi:hypothetical protein
MKLWLDRTQPQSVNLIPDKLQREHHSTIAAPSDTKLRKASITRRRACKLKCVQHLDDFIRLRRSTSIESGVDKAALQKPDCEQIQQLELIPRLRQAPSDGRVVVDGSLGRETSPFPRPALGQASILRTIPDGQTDEVFERVGPYKTSDRWRRGARILDNEGVGNALEMEAEANSKPGRPLHFGATLDALRIIDRRESGRISSECWSHSCHVGSS